MIVHNRTNSLELIKKNVIYEPYEIVFLFKFILIFNKFGDIEFHISEIRCFLVIVTTSRQVDK